MFLSHQERDDFRLSIRNMSKTVEQLENALKGGSGPNERVVASIASFSGSDDPEVHLRALTETRDNVQATYMSALREMGHKDFGAFCEYQNPDEPPESVFHAWLCDTLMGIENGEIMRMLLSVPPGHAKSTYASRLFSAWYLGRNPTHRFIQAGHTQGFCENEFGKKTKAIVDSQRYRDIFPEVMLATDSKAAGYWSIANYGGSYLTRGVGQGISGFRSHCAGVDDPFASREDAESQTIRDKVFDWFMADFRTRLLPKRPMYVVATRWHTDDLIGRLEEKSSSGSGMPWVVINLPALCEDPAKDLLKREENCPLWPSFYGYQELINLREDLPSRDWNSLYRGQPVDAEGGIIHLSWFQRYETPPPRDKVRRVTVSVDSAIKANERSDFTAIGVFEETFEGKHYLRHVIRKRAEFNEMVETVENTAIAWSADAILMEDKGSGTQYLQVRPGMPEETKAPCPAIAISTNNQSKEFRMDGVTPIIESGMVYLPHKAGWLALYEAELAGFPTSKYDDQCDFTSQYLDWSRKRVSGGAKKLGGTGVSATKKTTQQGLGKAKVYAEIEEKLRQIEEMRRQRDEPDAA